MPINLVVLHQYRLLKPNQQARQRHRNGVESAAADVEVVEVVVTAVSGIPDWDLVEAVVMDTLVWDMGDISEGWAMDSVPMVWVSATQVLATGTHLALCETKCLRKIKM